MSKLSAAEIERHFEDSLPADDVLAFEPPAHDEVIEELYNYAQDAWLFDDYYEDLDDHYDDRYDDPYPHEDDIYY